MRPESNFPSRTVERPDNKDVLDSICLNVATQELAMAWEKGPGSDVNATRLQGSECAVPLGLACRTTSAVYENLLTDRISETEAMEFWTE